MRLALLFSRVEVAALLAPPNSTDGVTARRPFTAGESPARQWLDGVEIARDLFYRGAIEPNQVTGTVAAFWSPVSPTGIIETDPRAGIWAGYDLIRGLREHFGTSNATALSRVEAEARYEARYGAARDLSSWFYLRLAERIESYAIWKGQPIATQTGALFIEKDGALDEWSRRGTLGAYCSGEAFNSRAASYGMTLRPPAQIFSEGAARTNFAAQALTDDFIVRLAQGISGVLAMFGPIPLIVGGEFGREIWPYMEKALALKLREMAPPRTENFSLQLAQGDQNAALWGALEVLGPEPAATSGVAPGTVTS